MVNVSKEKLKEILGTQETLISRCIQNSLDRPWDFPQDDIPTLEELRGKVKEFRKTYLKEQ